MDPMEFILLRKTISVIRPFSTLKTYIAFPMNTLSSSIEGPILRKDIILVMAIDISSLRLTKVLFSIRSSVRVETLASKSFLLCLY